mmetsp:Transcript_10971/g.31226  ORF Transcript_10971/g.31226 Transcript_10971/m.31226 type:complete len:104 (-) Transcript_10971:142-453(-)
MFVQHGLRSCTAALRASCARRPPHLKSPERMHHPLDWPDALSLGACRHRDMADLPPHTLLGGKSLANKFWTRSSTCCSRPRRDKRRFCLFHRDWHATFLFVHG